MILLSSTSCGIAITILFPQCHGGIDFTHPDFAMNLIEKLIQRVRNDTEDVKSLALTDVYGRLVRLISALAVERDGVMTVPEKLTQQDIAERVGASRDMISRLLKDLVTGGYLSIADKKITILKKPPTAW